MKNKHPENPNILIGCCGAYCKTCKSFSQNICKGCKIGYTNGERDINKARCKIKTCCFRDKKLETCADCPDFYNCGILNDFYGKNGYKYKKYKESIEFIIHKGYGEFLKSAYKWNGAYGKLGY